MASTLMSDPEITESLRPLAKALFLDRDGVINEDHGYVFRAAEIDFVPGIFPLVRQARAMGFLPVVVTNQSGIARGLYTGDDFAAVMAFIGQEFTKAGAALAAIYHCPHHAEEGQGALRVACNCRKPRPGMFLDAQRDLNIDMAASVMIGDRAGDMEAARAAKVGFSILFDPKGKEGRARTLADATVTRLEDAAALLARRGG